MQFFTTIVAGAAIVAGVLAQKPTIDTTLTEVTAGDSVEIKYSPSTATATFILRKGNPGDLDTLETITESATGGSFTWNVPSTLTDDDDYALEIKVGDEINYTGQFGVSGGSGTSSAESSGYPTATATVSASSKPHTPTATVTASVTGSESASASASVSGSISASSGSNSTVTSATLSTAVSETASTTGSEAATSTGDLPPESTGAASALSSSPLALVFGAIAAIAYLN